MMSATSHGHHWKHRHLRKNSKIISYCNEHFTLHSENLEAIINSTDAAQFDSVALLSIIGPPSSGKSFYTNLLIHYLQNDGASGWMTNLSSVRNKAENIDPLTGFSYGNVQSPENILPDDPESGIYIWPKSFWVKNFNGKLIVWILHVHLSKDERRDEVAVGLINTLLNLLSSKIIEIKWNNDEFSFLETRNRLQIENNIDFSKETLCKSFVQLVRTSDKPSKVILCEDSEAVKHLQKLIPPSLVNSLQGLECIRVVYINDHEKPLHDQDGYLSLHTKTHERLDKTIKLIGDWNDIHPKVDLEAKTLRLCEMKNFVLACVVKANLMHLEENKRALNIAFRSDAPSFNKKHHNNESHSTSLYPDIAEDMGKRNVNIPTGIPSSATSAFEVYQADSKSNLPTYNQSCGNDEVCIKPPSPLPDNKEQALKKEKVSNDISFEERENSPGIASQFKNENCDIANVEDMDVDDNSKLDNAAKCVQGEGSEDQEKKVKRNKEEEKAKRRFEEESSKREKEEEKQRAKLEMEEKKRQEEEQRKALEEKIDKLVVEASVAASVDIQAGMIKALNKWLDDTLTPATINYCEKIYEKQYLEVKNDIKYRKMKQTAIIGKFTKLLREKTEGCDLRVGFKKLQQFIAAFHSNIDATIAIHGYLWECRFNQLIEEEFHRGANETGLKTDELSTEYIFRACNKLALTYKDHNRRIIHIEEILILSNFESVKEEYNKQMKRVLNKNYFSPAQLANVHHHLTNNLIDGFTTAFQFKSPDSKQFFTDRCQGLFRQFEEEFKPYKITNRLKLEMPQKGVNKLISNCKAQYDGTMDNTLRQNCNGLPLPDFTNIHEKACQEARRSLENGIRQYVSELEPIEVHLRTLQSHIDCAWPSLLDENRACLRNSQENRQHANENIAGVKSTTHAGSSSNHNNNNKLKEEKTKTVLQEPLQKTQLSPLILHLSLNHVRAGIHHGNELFHLMSIPAVVGITKDNEWICGKDNLQEESTKVWLIRDCQHCEEEVKIGDTVNKITLEFLLAFLYQSLKENVEDMLNGEIKNAVFIIPFWFTSTQRQQVKDAGIIAGFSETLLINENSAIAFNVTKECQENCDIVVLSENSCHVDVTIFAFDKQKKNLKMRGHHAVYEKKEKQRKPRPSMLSFEYWSSFSLAFGSEVSDNASTAVYEAYKLAMKKADANKSSKYDKLRLKHFVASFESGNWKNVLVRAAQSITEKYKFAVFQLDNLILDVGTANRNPLSFYEFVQDFISFTIYRMSRAGCEIMVQNNNTVLPLNGISSDLPSNISNARFYQKSNSGEVVIGNLILDASFDEGLVKLEINNEGIISLFSVSAKSKNEYRTRSNVSKKLLKEDQYTWTTPNLSNDDIVKYASLLTYFKDVKKASVTSGETEQAKQELIGKGQELTERIAKKEGKFRSDLGRHMVKDQISEALELLKHPKISKNDIEKQMELFSKLEAKYFPQ